MRMFFRELRENVEAARGAAGQLDAALAEVRAKLAQEEGDLMALDVLQALAVEQALLKALQANSEGLLVALEQGKRASPPSGLL